MNYVGHEGRIFLKRRHCRASPDVSVVQNPPANAGDTGLSPDLGRSHKPRRNKALCHNY